MSARSVRKIGVGRRPPITSPAEARAFRGTDVRDYIIVVNRNVNDPVKVNLELSARTYLRTKHLRDLRSGTLLSPAKENESCFVLEIQAGRRRGAEDRKQLKRLP